MSGCVRYSGDLLQLQETEPVNTDTSLVWNYSCVCDRRCVCAGQEFVPSRGWKSGGTDVFIPGDCR